MNRLFFLEERHTNRCKWCLTEPLYGPYHDAEWGIPCHDDKELFERLVLEAFSCGLSWVLMLKKRDILRVCFADFDYRKVALFTDTDVNRIMEYPGMIKSRPKIQGTINNARCFIQVQQEFGSFDRYIWHFTNGQTYIYRRHLDGEWLTNSALSDEVAKDLKKRGFKYLGSTIDYSFLQSIGVINDHDPDCFMFKQTGGIVV